MGALLTIVSYGTCCIYFIVCKISFYLKGAPSIELACKFQVLSFIS